MFIIIVIEWLKKNVYEGLERICHCYIAGVTENFVAITLLENAVYIIELRVKRFAQTFYCSVIVFYDRKIVFLEMSL